MLELSRWLKRKAKQTSTTTQWTVVQIRKLELEMHLHFRLFCAIGACIYKRARKRSQTDKRYTIHTHVRNTT